MELEETAMLAKLAPGEFIALEAKYTENASPNSTTEQELLTAQLLV